MKRPYLTVLTTPILPASRRVYRRLRQAARTVVKPGVPLPASSPYPGHYAVVRSVVEGLRAIGADFGFNPTSFRQLARVVYAPANEALLQAIELKERGAIDYLVAGPVNALLPDEDGGIVLRPELDLHIVASEWAIDLYCEFPDLVRKCRACPCGVDVGYWTPTAPARRRAAVIYWKSGDERFCEAVEAKVRRRGLEPLRVRSKHGEHAIFEPATYRQALDGALVGIFLSSFETQGIALAEAWAMNVPTIVWDPQGEGEWRGRTFPARSSAPYLTPSTGVTWRTLDELGTALDRALGSLDGFEPRAWVLAHMTDAICSRKLYGIIREAAAERMPTGARTGGRIAKELP